MELNELWGAHTVDCFASFYNKKLDRFFSRFWNPGCAGVDAFYQSWTGENCLVVPPVSIVSRVLQYMCSQQCWGRLSCPNGRRHHFSHFSGSGMPHILSNIDTRKYNTLQDPSPHLLHKIICEHLYELVITIQLTSMHFSLFFRINTVYTVS